jgi:uncharacterized membrane protein
MDNNNLRNKAYQEALKFKKSGLEEEVIYAKLEKQGIPIDLAKEVAMNVVIERNKYNKKESLSNYKTIGIVMIIIWILVSIIAYIIIGRIFVIVGFLFVSIPATILGYLMATKK